MKMSLEYMRETATAMCEHGYHQQESSGIYGTDSESDNSQAHAWTRFAVKNEDSEFLIETVQLHENTENYYLEIINHHGLRSFSFKIDSWKYFPDRVEFKYYVMPESGTGLSFILALL